MAVKTINTSGVYVTRYLVMIIVLILYHGMSHGAESLKVITTEEPPLSYKENSQVTGLVTDIVIELIKRTNSKAVVKIQPWNRAYATGLREKNVVLFTAGRTQQREELFHWIGPVIKKHWVLISNQKSNIKISSLNDLKAVGKIGVVRADAKESYLKSLGLNNIHAVGTYQQAFKMLSLSRLDLVVTADVEIPVVANHIGFSAAQFPMVYKLREIGSYIVMSKGTSRALVNQWQLAFKGLKEDGFIAKVARQWSKKLAVPLNASNGVIELSP